MAGETNKVQLEAALSVEKLVTGLQNSRNEADKLRGTISDLNKQLTDGFNGSAGAAKKMGEELGGALGKIDQQQKLIASLRGEIDNLQKTSAKGFDTTTLEAYKKKIGELESELSSLKNEAGQAAKTMVDTGNTGAKSIELLRSKLQATKNEQKQLKEEIKGYNAAIKETERQTKALEKELGKQTASTIEGKRRTSELRSEIKELNKEGVSLENQLKGSRQKLEDVTDSIKKQTKEVVQAEKSSGSYFTKFYGYLRQAAAFLPGFGIAGLIGAGVEGAITLFGSLADSIGGVSREQKLLNGIIDESKSSYVQAASTVAELNQEVKLAKEGFIDKEDVVKHYNETLGQTMGTVQNLDEVEQKLTANGPAYIEMMFKKAQANLALQKASEAALEIELIRSGQKKLPGFAKDTILEQAEEVKQAYLNIADDMFEEVGKIAKKNKFDFAGDISKDVNEAAKQVKTLETVSEKAANAAGKLQKKSESDRRKANAEREREVREEEARLQRILSLEKQLAELRIELLSEGKAKDRASETARFDTAIAALENLKKKSKTSAEEIKLIDQLIEGQKQLHVKKLLDIDKKYYDDAIKAFDSAQDSINNVLLKDEEKEQADLNQKYDRIAKALQETRKKLVESAGNDKTLRLINFSFDDKEKDLQEQKAKESLAITQKYNLQKIDEQEKLALAINDVLTKQGTSEEELEIVKETNKLNITIEFAKKKLAILKATDTNDARLQAAQLEKVIQDAEKGLKKLGGKKDFFEVIFGKGKIDERTKQFVRDSVSELFQGVTDLIDQQIDARQRLIDKIDEQIDKQQEAVDREKELAEKGFANNLQLEEQRLTALQKKKDQELEQERKLQAEKAALQRTQIIADSIAQGSNLVTASTEIFKVLAKLGPIGVGLAIASITAMVAGFIASKAAALKAVGDVPKFRQGDRFDIYNALEGAPSHEGGGAGLYDERTGRKLAEFEGREKLFIVNRVASQKYEPLLDAINRDELSSWTYDDVRKFIQPSGLSFEHEKYAPMIRTTPAVVQPAANKTAIENNRYLERIAITNEKLLALEMEKDEVQDLEDKTIIRKGNHTRIIHKKQDGTV